MRRASMGPGAGRTLRPSVRAVGVLFVAVGVLDVARGIAPLVGTAPLRQLTTRPLAGDDLLVLALGGAALLGGLFVLRGRPWARWVLAGWMALHLGISAGVPAELAIHLVVFGVVAFVLFGPRASTRGGATAARGPGTHGR